jgi:putative solute:sodium symporter small subunit
MDNSNDEYHISFFKPTTPQAVANRNMVVWFVLIWFTAIFGFQILLKILEKPTPEPSYIIFEKVWGDVKSGNAGESELQEFGQSTLSVLGKVMISPDERAALDNALSWTISQLTTDSLREEQAAKIRNFETIKASISDISDPDYITAKKDLSLELSPKLGLSQKDVRSKILPLELSADLGVSLTEETTNTLPGIMKKYLVHNQSVLTDFKFLGFPFHYFYTAIFLLILFVGLCWLYCVRTDSLNKRLNIID